jgi:hypothetical protein
MLSIPGELGCTAVKEPARHGENRLRGFFRWLPMAMVCPSACSAIAIVARRSYPESELMLFSRGLKPNKGPPLQPRRPDSFQLFGKRTRGKHMAQFYPFLDAEHAKFPELAPDDYRLAAIVGAVERDQLIPGPALDTSLLDDIHAVLMLLGLAFDALEPISRRDGRSSRGVWQDFEPITALTREIVFAVGDPAAQEFLLDLKTAVEMIKIILPEGRGGCLLQVILPSGLH